MYVSCAFFFFQAEDGIRDLVRSRGLGDVYKRQDLGGAEQLGATGDGRALGGEDDRDGGAPRAEEGLSLIHI